MKWRQWRHYRNTPPPYAGESLRKVWKFLFRKQYILSGEIPHGVIVAHTSNMAAFTIIVKTTSLPVHPMYTASCWLMWRARSELSRLLQGWRPVERFRAPVSVEWRQQSSALYDRMRCTKLLLRRATGHYYYYYY